MGLLRASGEFHHTDSSRAHVPVAGVGVVSEEINKQARSPLGASAGQRTDSGGMARRRASGVQGWGLSGADIRLRSRDRGDGWEYPSSHRKLLISQKGIYDTAFLRSRVTAPPGSYRTVPSIIPCILSSRLASLGGAACCCAGGTPRHAGVCVWGPSLPCVPPRPHHPVTFRPLAVLCVWCRVGAGRAQGFGLSY